MNTIEEIKKLEAFRDKVQKMSGKEIVMTMLESIKNPVVTIDMDTFGRREENVCFGCAATNFICKGADLNLEFAIREDRPFWDIGDLYQDSLMDFFSFFESAIDALRRGNITSYNLYAEELGLRELINEDIDLPTINNHNYQNQKVLQSYIDFANSQDNE